MKRRNFVRNVGAGIILPKFIHGMDLKLNAAEELAAAMSGNTDHILIVVQLEGGNDGLNTLLPVDQNYDRLLQLRPNIISGTSSKRKDGYLPLNNVTEARLHPSMEAVKNLYNEGMIQFINGVSIGNHSSSHPAATRMVLNASTRDLNGNYGWLGELLESKYPGYTDFSNFPNNLTDFPVSIEFGNYSSLLLQASSGPMNVLLNSARHFCNLYFGTTIDAQGNCTYKSENSCSVTSPIPGHSEAMRAQSNLQYLRAFSQVADKYACVLRKAYDKSKSNSVNTDQFLGSICGYNYNENKVISELDVQMRTIAYWINGGLPTQVYQVRHDGYDLHGGLSNSHGYLLNQVSGSIANFMQLLAPEKRDKVLGIVITEFARTIKENGSQGADHGTSNMMFTFGHQVNGGILGKNPTIPDPQLFNDPKTFDLANNQASQFDFRSVYNTIMRQWFCVDEPTVQKIIGGKKEDSNGNVIENWDLLPLFKNSPCCTDLAQPVITGNQQVCADGTYTYSTAQVTGATYNWTIQGGRITAGQGSATVSVAWDNQTVGTLNVKVSK